MSFMGKGMDEGRVATENVRYLANQMGFHEFRIDDNDRDLHELMGTIDIIKEELQKLTNMNQCINCQETSTNDHPMEESSVVQPAHGPGEKKK